MGNDRQRAQDSDELDEGQLESVVGGVSTGVPPADPSTSSSDDSINNVLKTRHETAKNAIGNIR